LNLVWGRIAFSRGNQSDEVWVYRRFLFHSIIQ
jgi:hypothetical protein